MSAALFDTGVIVATPGVLDALRDANVSPTELLNRHVHGDWGDLDNDDKRENDFSVGRPLRIFSAYVLPTSVRVWLITEADRSSTTLLLPSEY